MKTIKNTPLRGLTALLLLIVVGIGWLSGCQSDDLVEATPPANGDDVQLTFRVSDASDPGTYLPSGFKDDTAKDLMALIFTRESKINGDSELRYRCFRQVTLKGNEHCILLPSTLRGIPLTLVLCANATSVLTDNPDKPLIEKTPRTRGCTYEDLVEKLTSFSPDCRSANFELPMWAEIKDVTVAADAPKQNLGKGVLLRSLCRVDVGINYPHAGNIDDAAAGLPGNFTLSKVHIARSYKKAQLIPAIGEWELNGDTYTIKSPSIPKGGAPEVQDWLEFTPGATTTGKACQEMIYLPEQPNSEKLDECPCVILEGEYTYPGGGGTVTGFYRVDYVTDDGTRRNLLRGHLFRFNITAVKGPGYDNRDDALNSKPMNIEVKLADYTIFNSNTIFDGQYHFTLNKKEVTMPRDMNVKYTLSVNTNIPVGEWKMRLKVWNSTTPDDQASNPTIDNGNFRVTKTPGTDDNHTLTIETIKNWNSTDAQQNEATLLIDAKRLKIQIPLHQIDQSVQDWQVGNVTDDKLDGSIISRVAFNFTGADHKDVIEIYTGGSGTTYTVALENLEGGPLVQPKKWLTVTQRRTNPLPLLPTFDLTLAVNPDDVVRQAIIVLTEEGVVPGQEHVFRIPLTQEILPTSDLLDPVNGVLWHDRNVGAATSAFNDGNFPMESSDVYIGKAYSLCPVGWVVPSRDDFEALFNHDWYQELPSGYRHSGLPNKLLTIDNLGGIEYVMVYDATTKLFFQSRNLDTWFGSNRHWFVREAYLETPNINDSRGALAFVPNRGYSYIEGLIADLNGRTAAIVRCVRKLTLDKMNVTLPPTGEYQYVNMSTLESGETVNMEFVGPNPNGVFVRRDSPTRLVIGATLPNMTSAPIEVRVNVSGTRFPHVKRPLKISQAPASPLVDAANPFVTVGNVEWYGKNIGASSYNNGYVHYKLVRNPNEGISFGRDYATLNLPANVDLLSPGGETTLGTMYEQGSGKAQCETLGEGWRLPTPFEWRELLARTRVVRGQLSTITTGSQVLHNTTEYPEYIVDDGKRRMYLSVGRALNSTHNDALGMPVRVVSYHTSAGIGVSYTHVHLSRYLYGDKAGVSYSYQWPWEGDFMNVGTGDNTHLASFVNYVAIQGYLRCVRSKKVK